MWCVYRALGPRTRSVVALSLEFSDSLTTPEIEEKVTALERGIRQAFPDVIAIFVKPADARHLPVGAATAA